MILDNIEKVLPLLVFNENTYYFLQVIRRKKDGKGSDSKIYSRFITSKESLLDSISIIKLLCDNYNARCYISLLPRNIEQLTKQLNLRTSKQISEGQYTQKTLGIIDSISLSSSSVKWKGVLDYSICMIDLDEPDALNSLLNIIQLKKIKIREVLPSVHGYHIISEFFYPGILGLNKKSENDWEWEDENGLKHCFTFCPDVNTLLYAKTL